MTRHGGVGSSARDGPAPDEERQGRRTRQGPAHAATVAEATLARDLARALEARACLVAEASRVLAASLDVDATLAQVARLAVPMLGDWCLIDVAAEHHGTRRVAVAHADPDREAAARAFER